MKTNKKLEDAKLLLSQSKKPGFRKANKKALHEAEAIVKQDFVDRGNEFMKRYKELCKDTGMEIVAKFEQAEGYPPNIAKAALQLAEYQEPQQPETKPWSEAMASNLDMRAACEHVEHEEGNICEKCGTAVNNWGEDNKGVSPEYREKIMAKIEEEKKKEVDKAASKETAEGEDK